MKSKIQGGAAWGWENTRIRKNGLKTCILYDVMHFRGIWGSWISIALELTACENASLRGKWQPASVIIYWHKQQVCLLVLIRPTQHRLSDGICSFVWACGWEQYSKSFSEVLCHLHQGASALVAWALQEKAAGCAGSSWGARNCAAETPYIQKVFEWQECWEGKEVWKIGSKAVAEGRGAWED